MKRQRSRRENSAWPVLSVSVIRIVVLGAAICLSAAHRVGYLALLFGPISDRRQIQRPVFDGPVNTHAPAWTSTKEMTMYTMKRLIAGLAVIAMAGVAAPASAGAEAPLQDEFEYAFFYGTFDESPNVAMFAGGTLEEVCFDDAGSAPLRVFFRSDGSVDLKVNAKNQEIYLYRTDFNDIPEWLDAVCPGIVGGADAPEPFAEGVANLKVRISEGADGLVEVFNSVNGKATGTDGTNYKVRGAADLVIDKGELQGDPRDFVSFDLKKIGR